MSDKMQELLESQLKILIDMNKRQIELNQRLGVIEAQQKLIMNRMNEIKPGKVQGVYNPDKPQLEIETKKQDIPAPATTSGSRRGTAGQNS